MWVALSADTDSKHKLTHMLKENKSVCKLAHTVLHALPVLLSASWGGGQLTEAKASAEFAGKVWNVPRRLVQAVLKGISITSRQVRPYVMVTSLKDTFLNWCSAHALLEIYWPTVHFSLSLRTHDFQYGHILSTDAAVLFLRKYLKSKLIYFS